jgi:hypothetical protein
MNFLTTFIKQSEGVDTDRNVLKIIPKKSAKIRLQNEVCVKNQQAQMNEFFSWWKIKSNIKD